MELVLKPAKAGCLGCYYEDKDECPGDTANFEKCIQDGRHMIFVPAQEDNNGRTV